MEGSQHREPPGTERRREARRWAPDVCPQGCRVLGVEGGVCVMGHGCVVCGVWDGSVCVV